ncbi:snaclec 5-like [Ruditapes philippinarum]|uniref:snaclec 5-like n=1 Tax=Ruditapes philippinarum TaxID=129788 RepID=UPI00295BF9BA|nr:snaclec 5-like [Ruditapes philippinarum]
MGMKLRLPNIRMIGKAIENIEVKIESSIEKLENETARKICDLNPCLPWTSWSKCSSNIHLFGSNDKTRNKKEAELQCQDDNGHLVNIDSEIKYEDVKNLMEGFRSYVWIDGYRKDVSSPWAYTYGSQKGFFKWQTNQPSNGSSELCLIGYRYSGGIQWLDNNCNSAYYSICEVIS